jgi:murein DD-endopeptidase MepM/ murein hydrolase activator NlpD
VTAGWAGGYGNLVSVQHANGLATYYAHLARVAATVGMPVCETTVGYSGSTGQSTGPHLHFEVRLYGVPQNPVRYLP